MHKITLRALGAGLLAIAGGDTAWQIEGIELPADRPWLSRSLVDRDAPLSMNDHCARNRHTRPVATELGYGGKL